MVYMKKKLKFVMLFFALNIVLFIICSSAQAASSVTVNFSHISGADYNIHGTYGSSDIKTTYSDAGYRTVFRVNKGTEHEVTSGSGTMYNYRNSYQ